MRKALLAVFLLLSCRDEDPLPVGAECTDDSQCTDTDTCIHSELFGQKDLQDYCSIPCLTDDDCSSFSRGPAVDNLYGFTMECKVLPDYSAHKLDPDNLWCQLKPVEGPYTCTPAEMQDKYGDECKQDSDCKKYWSCVANADTELPSRCTPCV